MQTYLNMLQYILDHGDFKGDRTGTGTQSVFGYQLRHRLDASYLPNGELVVANFPLLTTKDVSWHNIIVELMWFLRGETNIKPLVDAGVNIWNDWPYKHYVSQHPNTLVNKAEFAQAIKNNPEFAAEWGELGPVYGSQWRKWKNLTLWNAIDAFIRDSSMNASARAHVKDLYRNDPVFGDAVDSQQVLKHHSLDQIGDNIKLLKAPVPTSRRMVVSAWNPAELDEMVVSGLPPCHCLFQFNTVEISVDGRIGMLNLMRNGWKGTGGELQSTDDWHAWLDGFNIPKYYLDLQLYQRSCDTFIGVPYNIASYAALLAIMAKEVNMVPRDFVHSYGDLHIYNNHRDQVAEQLTRSPVQLPTLRIDGPTKSIEVGCTYEESDFELIGYTPAAAIKAPIAV